MLDLARRQASLRRRRCDLSDREFRLLHHLLQHAGEVISRERLLAEVWGYHFDPGSNVVDVCVAAAEEARPEARSRRFAMRVIDLLRRNPSSWPGPRSPPRTSPRWALAELGDDPFHFVWVSLTLLFGFRVWGLAQRTLCSPRSRSCTGRLIFIDAFDGTQLWGELFEVPLMSAMFLAMVWHARRRQDALRRPSAAEERAALLERQERFLTTSRTSCGRR